MRNRRVALAATASCILAFAGCASPAGGNSQSNVSQLPVPGSDADLPRMAAGVLLDDSKSPAPPASFRISPAGLSLTKSFELWVPTAYPDPAGYCTIGYGHLIRKTSCDTPPPLPNNFRVPLTLEEGERLLADDMRFAEGAIQRHVKVPLAQHQFDALCDFVFNVGEGAFQKSTLLRHLNSGEWGLVAPQFRRWVKAGGVTYRGLERRRNAEIAMFFQGKIPPPPPGAAIDTSEIDIRVGE